MDEGKTTVMNYDLRIDSVNLGKPAALRVGNALVETGIYKEPSPDGVWISQDGLDGDVIVDIKSHGGSDQAVYLYSQEDYEWWSNELGEKISGGTFGENLTLSSFGPSPLKVGDRFQINEVLLEVSFPRIPCAKLGARMDDQKFVKRFVQAGRPGIYARVLNPGWLQVGEPVMLLPNAVNYPRIAELYSLWFAKERSPDLLQKGLEAPIAERARAAFEFWLNESTKSVD